MDNKFETLNDETAILMLDQDVFTVARLKKLVQNQLSERLSKSFRTNDRRTIKIDDFFNPDLDLFDEEVRISLKDFKLRFPPKGLECKLLNLQTKEWQTGKVRILADVKIILDESSDDESNDVEIQKMIIEFASDKPTFEYESSLDKIKNSSL